ncbi:MAG: hypothetical protein JXB10_13690 [Pirellulales bacterium]|nr:hypothetical protein [Pirellulales bacterium]
MKNSVGLVVVLLGLIVAVNSSSAWGQGYGTDSQNVLTPAAGGMAGVSLARPQDVPAAIFGNPSTLAQFHGTQFTLGGAWVEGYPTVTNNGSLLEIPFSMTSRTQGFAIPEIGVIQDLRALGLPGSLGLGLSGLSGLGAEYRGKAPEGSFVNNITEEYMVLGINIGAGVEVTERLSAGAALTLGTGFEQLGLVGPITSTAMVHDYALRGTFGLDYDLNPRNTIGLFYQTRMDFDFPQAVRIGSTYHDLHVAQPQTLGLGWANSSMLDGNLLIAFDVYYKLWEDAPLYEDVYINQWAFALGTQLTRGMTKYRLGYSYNSNPLNHSVGDNLSGLPVGQAAVQLFQAASVATINQHRITGGIGRQGVLIPTLDLDLFAGGLFPAHDEFGDTEVSVAAYYLGLGLTWRYGDYSSRPQ